MKIKRKLGKKMLLENVQTFKNRAWLCNENKNLLSLIHGSQLNLAPATLYKLDQLGLNHLEIINFSACVGKKIHTLPTADIDFLNIIESKFKINIGYEKKAENKPHLAKVDHFCYGMNSEGFYPLGVCAIFGLDLYI